ncbi:perilipin-3-like [Hyperolius riggenbachi]|uniref:perilipin-3-like n=1 Tax=Hyperolius riggenbachi TaxID=752182 RepID=UPI0035A3C3EE
MAEKDHQDKNENAQNNVLQRLANLPLFQSAFQIAFLAYSDVKSIHPVVGHLCEVSERGAKALSEVATFGVAPILKAMEPQISVVNNVALRVVEELEERLPVLDQPADEVASGLRTLLVDGIRGVKDRAVDRVQNIVASTQALFNESTEVVLLAVASLNTVGVGEMVRVVADSLLTRAEELVERYLPNPDAGGSESSSSSDSDETGGSRAGLVSRSTELVKSVVTRILAKLAPYMGRSWRLLQTVIQLLFSIPDQVRRFFQALLSWSVPPQKVSKKEARYKATPKKKKMATTQRSRPPQGRVDPGLPDGGSVIVRVTSDGRRLSLDTDLGRLETQMRKQSSPSSAKTDSEVLG